MMKTLRDLDYSADESEILARIKQARDALAVRQSNLSEWETITLRQQEEQQISFLDNWLTWLQFGGSVPYWIACEESRMKSERMVEVCGI